MKCLEIMIPSHTHTKIYDSSSLASIIKRLENHLKINKGDLLLISFTYIVYIFLSQLQLLVSLTMHSDIILRAIFQSLDILVNYKLKGY